MTRAIPTLRAGSAMLRRLGKFECQTKSRPVLDRAVGDVADQAAVAEVLKDVDALADQDADLLPQAPMFQKTI